jgi:SAM-dependent MidA family methyltransferase
MLAAMPQNDTGLLRDGVLVRDEIALSAAEVEHTQLMGKRIAAEIRAADGWISFESYMDLALYAPGLGYYAAGARKLGPGGDFVTAPEISRLFGGCVALECAQVLSQLGAGSIMEIGAGTGALAADVLLRLDALGRLPARYLILEVSADLRERQREALQTRAPHHLRERVEWLDGPPTVPFDGIVLANEVLDALPVTRFRWNSGRCEELGVAVEHDRLVWAARPAPVALEEICRSLAQSAGGWDDGYASEYCPRLADWTLAVTRPLQNGAVLWIDYGLPRSQYYLRERRDGTLLCHFRQRAHDDPLLYPGLSDITAWVDFTRLAQAGAAAGFSVAGFTTQTYFLSVLGIDREMQRLAGADQIRFARLANEARRLLLPGEMGERFKVMAWLKGTELALRGFALKDLRHSL